MRRGSRLLCIGIAACMMCGCGILPTEEEFDARIEEYVEIEEHEAGLINAIEEERDEENNL